MTANYRNHMGDDLEVVNDARISFAATTEAVGWHTVDTVRPDPIAKKQALVPELSPRDKGLIRFLARGCKSSDWEAAVRRSMNVQGELAYEDADALLRHVRRIPTHWTPFAQQNIKVRMKAPVPIRTQAYKHKIGMVENEESRRYIRCDPEIFVPEFRLAPEGDIKQGSAGPHPDNEALQQLYIEQTEASKSLYLYLLDQHVAPEQARFALPQGTNVNWVWNGSLYAYAEFYNKRADRGHAQAEIADLADALAEVIQPLFPVSWAALTS